MESLEMGGAMDKHGVEKHILVVGSANMDMVVSCDRFPQPGETILASDFGMYPGGKGANQAVASARLGGQVDFLAKLGNDVFRERLLESLTADAVLVDRVLVDPSAPTGVALISVNCDGENEIMVVSGSNMKLTPDDVDRSADVFDGAAVVLLQLEIPLPTVQRAAELGKERGAIVILNPAPAQPLPAELLRYVDFLTPNETEAGILSGLPVTDIESAAVAGQALRERGVKTVVVTLGARGALVVGDTGARHFPTNDASVVDTTGAGDAFNGALAYALAEGYSLGDAVGLANAVAAFSVTRIGAQAAMPTLDDISEAAFREAGKRMINGAIK
ncbi:MAG: ribokinase [Bacteroidota bacterium]